MEPKPAVDMIERVLEARGGIPPIPVVACEVLKLAGSEDARLSDIARLIASDPGLATQVLRACNSAYYGIPQPVRSISGAVALLGFKTVRNLVVLHSLPRGRAGTPGFAETTIWTHSAAAALTARLLANHGGEVDPEEAMLAGLIHDMGRLVLNLLMPDHYAPVMHAIYNREGTSIELERRALGTDHAAVGEIVLRHWRFPEDLVQSVARHHDDPETLDALTLRVRAADEILWALGIGVRAASDPLTEMPPALRRLGHTLEEWDPLEARVVAAIEAGQEFFG